MLEALRLAAADTDPAVVNHALDALQPVVEALYRRTGTTLCNGSHCNFVRGMVRYCPFLDVTLCIKATFQ